MDPINTNLISLSNREASQQAVRSFREMIRLAGEKLQQPQNNTFSSDVRRDRVNPTSEENASRAILPKDTDGILNGSPHLSTIQSGTFQINNVPISIDPAVDSLREIVQKINSSSAGVTARFDFETNQLVIQSDSGKQFDIHSDSSNLLRELNVLEGSYNGSTDFPDVTTIGSAFPASEIVKEINSIIRNVNMFLKNQSVQQEVKNEVVSSLKKFISDQTGASLDVPGVDYESNSIYFQFNQDGLSGIQINTDRLFDQVSKNPTQLKSFFNAKEGFSNNIQERLSDQKTAEKLKQSDIGNNIDMEG